MLIYANLVYKFQSFQNSPKWSKIPRQLPWSKAETKEPASRSCLSRFIDPSNEVIRASSEKTCPKQHRVRVLFPFFATKYAVYLL